MKNNSTKHSKILIIGSDQPIELDFEKKLMVIDPMPGLI